MESTVKGISGVAVVSAKRTDGSEDHLLQMPGNLPYTQRILKIIRMAGMSRKEVFYLFQMSPDWRPLS